MSAYLKLIYLFVIIFTFSSVPTAEGKCHRHGRMKRCFQSPQGQRSSAPSIRTKCFLADSSFYHEPSKSWTRTAGLLNLHASPKLKGINKWLVYVIYVEDRSRTAVLEFVHRTRDGKCQFLVRKTPESPANMASLTRPMSCQPGQNGERTLFRTTMARPRMNIRSVSENRRLVAVYSRQKRMLTLSGASPRRSDVAWWNIDMSTRAPCPYYH